MNTVYTSGQLVKFTELGEQKGLNPERFQLLLQSGFFSDLLEINLSQINRDDFREAMGLLQLKFDFVVDYNETKEQLINQGNYDFADHLIDDLPFPISVGKIEKITGELVVVDYTHGPLDVKKQLEKSHLRTPTLAELLTFGALFPKVQTKFELRVIGLVCDEWSKMPWICGRDKCSCESKGYRNLNVGVENLLNPRHFVSCRFLGIRE